MDVRGAALDGVRQDQVDQLDDRRLLGLLFQGGEVEVLFLSFSVQISCEKKFAGANGDPTFAEVMGAPPGQPRPWDAYCLAFADE